MPNPSKHRYEAPSPQKRLLLLAAVLAMNPGIGNRRTDAKGKDAMDVIQEAMVSYAAERGIEYKPVSVATLRLDIRYLKTIGMMQQGTAQHRGYFLGENG